MADLESHPVSFHLSHLRLGHSCLVNISIIGKVYATSFPTLESLGISLWNARDGIPDPNVVFASGAPNLRHLSITGSQALPVDYDALFRYLPLLESLSLCAAARTLPLVGPSVPSCLTKLSLWDLSDMLFDIPNLQSRRPKLISAVTASLALPSFANLEQLVLPEVAEATWQESNDAERLLATCGERGIAVFCRGDAFVVRPPFLTCFSVSDFRVLAANAFSPSRALLSSLRRERNRLAVHLYQLSFVVELRSESLFCFSPVGFRP